MCMKLQLTPDFQNFCATQKAQSPLSLSLMKTPKPCFCNKIPENQLLLLFDRMVLSINCIKMILLVTKIKSYKEDLTKKAIL